ncbi:MAG: SCO family protein [Desulforhopalus sp.]
MKKLKRMTRGAVWAIALLLSFVAAAGAKETKMYKRTLEEYVVPDVTLLDQEGREVQLKSYFDTDKPILLDFIYGTCTTICPVLSVGFAYFQKKLGPNLDQVRMVSISIDPDNDTPELMKEYLQKYGAQPGWDALTGKREDVIQVLMAFDAYVANKMNHYPLTILRAPGEKEWVRIYGMLSASDLISEHEQLK